MTIIRAARGRTPNELARIARREVGYRSAAETGRRRLARAAKTGAPVLAGPFVGEVGFELLYWIPFLRRALARRGIPREQVTALTRGGAGCWYGDLAGNTVDALDLMSLDEYRRGLVERRERAGDHKLLSIDPFDQQLLDRASANGSVVLHPQAMYGRLRSVWAGWQSSRGADAVLAHARLSKPPRPANLPDSYVAVKAYFGDAFPATDASRAALKSLVEEHCGDRPVVLVSAGAPLDDHAEWSDFGADVVVTPADARTNLGDQTAAVAHADLLIAPYGGFSYLGPLLGVPTLALRAPGGVVNPVHLETLRRTGLADEYRVVDTESCA